MGEKKTIGILGGMGPLATSDLLHKIVTVTEAARDQDHVPVLVDNNTAIPDRLDAILGGGEDPVPEMTRSALRLQEAGADLLIMPCNTAHYFYPPIAERIQIPFLHMPEETAKELSREGFTKVGVLGTDGTIRSRIYHDILESYGIQVVVPDENGQQEVMHLIYDGVKAGQTIDIAGFAWTLDDLYARGAQRLILGCTELPVAYAQYGFTKEAADPTLILAKAAVKAAGGTLRATYG